MSKIKIEIKIKINQRFIKIDIQEFSSVSDMNDEFLDARSGEIVHFKPSNYIQKIISDRERFGNFRFLECAFSDEINEKDKVRTHVDDVSLINTLRAICIEYDMFLVISSKIYIEVRTMEQLNILNDFIVNNGVPENMNIILQHFEKCSSLENVTFEGLEVAKHITVIGNFFFLNSSMLRTINLSCLTNIAMVGACFLQGCPRLDETSITTTTDDC